MTYTSIIEKLQYLFEFIQSSYVYMIFIGIVMLLIFVRIFKKIKNNKFMIIMTIVYLTLFGIVIFNNYQNLGSTFDSIIDNIFTNIYFPSIYAYLFILGVVDIAFLISTFNIKIEKIYKIVNGVCFGIIQFILVIVMEIIAGNNIDVFDKSSLFTNVGLVAMLELSVNVFIVWLIVLGGIYVVNIITERILAKGTDKILENTPAVMNDRDLEVVINNNIESDYLYDNKTTNAIENNFSLNDLVHKSVGIEVDKEVISNANNISNNMVYKTNSDINSVSKPVNNNTNNVKEDIDSASVFDMILNNTLPVKKEEPVIEKNITNYTLNDYKLFNKMLKEIKMYNIGSIVNIDKSLELRLLDKFSSDEYNLFKQMLKSYSN